MRVGLETAPNSIWQRIRESIANVEIRIAFYKALNKGNTCTSVLTLGLFLVLGQLHAK